MNRTKIEWVQNPDGSQGYTCNLITGCYGPGGSAEKPNRCPWCYAWRLAGERLSDRYLANPDVIAGNPHDPFAPRWWWERQLDIPQGGRPKGIFLNDVGDMFGDWIPSELIQVNLKILAARPRHRFYILTKFPERLPGFNPYPPNVWVGATATTQQQWDAAIKGLASVQATVRYISAEPLVGPIRAGGVCGVVDWLIIGPCTGRLADSYPCVRSWIDDLEIAATNIPVFEKDACAKLITERPLRRELFL